MPAALRPVTISPRCPTAAAEASDGEIYVADGYGNHRVVVFDASGKFLRQWGEPGTDRGLFALIGGGHPHCAKFDHEGLLYVCDRGNDRIQVFDKMGAVKRVIEVKPGTAYSPAPNGAPGRKAIGSALDVAFSPDGTVIVTGSYDGTARTWEVETGWQRPWTRRHGSGMRIRVRKRWCWPSTAELIRMPPSSRTGP